MKMLLRILLAILAFLLGVIGMYFAMPYVAPQRVAQVQDSLAVLRNDTTAIGALGQQTLMHTDSLLDHFQCADSAALLALVSAQTALRDSLKVARDTLAQLRQALQTAQQQGASLRQALHQAEAQMQTLQQRLASLETQKARADELAATITRMEDKERRALVSQLPPEVIELLYQATSGRGRTLLLQSLPPEQAARLVNRLIERPTAQEVSLRPAGSQ